MGRWQAHVYAVGASAGASPALALFFFFLLVLTEVARRASTSASSTFFSDCTTWAAALVIRSDPLGIRRTVPLTWGQTGQEEADRSRG